MARRKGMSLEEKRAVAQKYFFEHPEPWQIKDMEKKLPKLGIIPQSVKEVVQSLADDNLIETDKIGVSTYFWSFPSQALVKRNNDINKLSNEIEMIETKISNYTTKIESAEAARSTTNADERDQLIQKLALLEGEDLKYTQELELYKENDPTLIEALQKDTNVAFEAANRWTDNIFTTRSWVCNKLSKESKEINKFFGIDPELDYIPEIK